MNNNELYNLLEFPKEVIQALNTYGESRNSSFHINLSDLMDDSELIQNLDKIILKNVGEDTDGIKTLWEELNIALQTYEEYKRKNIPKDIFINTMKFTTRFLLEYYKIHKCYHFVWGWWFSRQLSLKEFRVGALEYEFCEQNFINLHIPSDADLSPQSVSESISLFKNFCMKYFPDCRSHKIQCRSWMLSPKLENVLGGHSNILAFQKLFNVLETDYESMAVLDWVFPGYNTISEKLPEQTSLQKNMKKYLLEGNRIGWSKGVLSDNIF